MQGLIDETDKDFHHRIQRIRNLLLDNENKYKQSNVLTVETINFLKGNLISAQGKYQHALFYNIHQCYVNFC